MKVHLISNADPVQFQEWVNEFVLGKKIVNIKYQPIAIPRMYQNGVPVSFDVVDRALILYEEVSD